MYMGNPENEKGLSCDPKWKVKVRKLLEEGRELPFVSVTPDGKILPNFHTLGLGGQERERLEEEGLQQQDEVITLAVQHLQSANAVRLITSYRAICELRGASRNQNPSIREETTKIIKHMEQLIGLPDEDDPFNKAVEKRIFAELKTLGL